MPNINTNGSKNKSKPPRHLSVKIAGDLWKIPFAELRDPGQADDWFEYLQGADGKVVVGLKRLIEWPDEFRMNVLDFLASIERPVKYNGGTGIVHDDLFEAVLELIPDNADVDKFSRAKAAALELTALLYPGDPEGACDRILKRIRSHGVKGVGIRSLTKQVRQITQKLGAADSQGGDRRVIDVLPDAPVGPDAVIPLGWRLSSTGIERGVGDQQIRLPDPILITHIHQTVRERATLVSVTWNNNGEWATRSVKREQIASSRAIVDALAGYGAPVTSNDAAGFVAWLADYERANRETLPRTLVSRQLGWQDDDRFLLGERLIAHPDLEEDPGNPSIRFSGADGGDDQIAAGFRTRGDLQTWLKVIAPLRSHPRARLALYGAFVPPLLKILDAPNFVMDLAGHTSVGKTSALRIAAGVWGNPDEQSPATVLHTWDGTWVYRERLPAVCCDLPVILDDTKRAKRRQDVADTVYAIAQGMGRGRGSIHGLAQQQHYRTVLLMSGEEPATAYTHDGGTRARVLSLWGLPFDEISPAMEQSVRAMADGMKEHYGHAGAVFVQFLVDERDQWGTWRAEYRSEIDRYAGWAADEGNPVAGRMAAYCAVLSMASWLAHGALDLGWEWEDPIVPLWHELISGAADADRAAAALAFVYEWAVSHPSEFANGASEGRQPVGGWAGRWEKTPPAPDAPNDNSGCKWIGFIPGKLKELLRVDGYEPEAILRTWKDRGWLVLNGGADGGRRRTIKTKLAHNSPPVQLIAISGKAVEEVSGG